MVSFDEYTLVSGDVRVGVNPHGGYVSSWRGVLYQGKTLKRSGIPILFPQFSEANGMRKHGFARDSLFKIVTKTDRSIIMELDDTDIDEDAKKEYPHEFTIRITVEIGEQGALLYGLHVANTGKQNLPISPGLHPYWAVNHGDKKKIQIDGLPEFDAHAVDWDTNPPDIGYPYTGKIVIHLPQQDIAIEDITPGGPVIKHIVIWSQTPKQDDFHYICVEPVCGYIHALDTNPILISPGKEWEMKLRFSVHPLDL